MSRPRIALIFDNTVRPETTGTYCLRALRKLADVEFFIPDHRDRIPRVGFDLYLNIDDGLRYRLPPDLRPCAWWVIDTHMDLPWAIEKGKDFDWLFAAQRDGTEQLNAAGLSAVWLPLACDPGIHRPWIVQNQWDVCFVGRVSSGPRHELLQSITRHYPRSFVGQRYFDEYAQALCASTIGFNRSVKNDVNMRVFETLGCGSLLITNDLSDNGQSELFESDRHLVTYRDEQELIDKIRFYLKNQTERQRIAQAGLAVAFERHTYHHRMMHLLSVIETELNRTSVSVADRPGASSGQRSQEIHLAGAPLAMPVPLDAHSSFIIAGTKPANAANNGIASAAPMAWIDSVDFVIKTFLRPHALLRLMTSIDEQYPTAHVTIADDGGIRTCHDPDSKACCELIDSRNESVLIELPFASGVTRGRNSLVDGTRRPFLLFLDDDFAFTSQTNIERLFERLRADPAIGVIAGACIDVIHGDRRPRNSGGVMDLAGDVLEIRTQAWRDRDAGIREYVPQFAMIRREVFNAVRWEGGIGGEHYDFCLQLMQTEWKVVHDLSVVIDHHPLTESLAGYEQYRFDCAAAQQWLLCKWGLQQIVQDGKVIVERLPVSTDGSI